VPGFFTCYFSVFFLTVPFVFWKVFRKTRPPAAEEEGLFWGNKKSAVKKGAPGEGPGSQKLGNTIV